MHQEASKPSQVAEIILRGEFRRRQEEDLAWEIGKTRSRPIFGKS
jgi:hypothetical protein